MIIKIKKTVCIIAILVSTVLFNGCCTFITQNYGHKISMTKAEAVQTIKRCLSSRKNLLVDESSCKNLLVDEDYLFFTYEKKVIDFTWDTGMDGRSAYFSGAFGERPGIRHTKYHYEDSSLRLEFADVSKIKKFCELQSGCLIILYDNKGVFLNKDCRFYATNEFISALLTLCPNVK